MDSLQFNSALQEPDAELPGLELKKQLLSDLIGKNNFPFLYSSLYRLYQPYSNPEDLIHNFLTRLLKLNDVQSLQLLCLGGIPSLLEEAKKQLLSEV